MKKKSTPEPELPDQETTRAVLSPEGFKIPQGALIQEVEDAGDSWRGLWCSMWGSWYVTIKKKHCKNHEP